MGFIKRILLGKDEEEHTTLLSRQELLDRIFNHFLVRMEQETTTEGLLFPTSYVIYLNEVDYANNAETFAYTVKEAAGRMVREVEKRRQKYRNYQPHARYWQFQFVQFGDDNVLPGIDGMVEHLGPKELFVVSTIHPEPEAQEGGMQEHVVGTMHVKDSLSLSRMNINMCALRGVDIRSKDCFRVPLELQGMQGRPTTASPLRGNQFGKPMGAEQGNQWGTPICAGQGNQLGTPICAELRVSESAFLSGQTRSTVYRLTSLRMQASGRSDMENRGDVQVARLDNDRVLNPHVELEHLPHERLFRLRAWGDVRLNEVVLRRGVWVPLPNHSAILINGEIQLDFSF